MPSGHQASTAPAHDAPGSKPPALPTEGARAGSERIDRWGELPVHARDVFRAQGGGDMPARYRDWIDAYYRRLNQNPGG